MRPLRSCLLLLVLLLSCEGAPEASEEAPAEAAVPEAAAPSLLAEGEHMEIVGPEAPDMPWVVALHGLGDRPDSFWRVLEGHKQPLRIVALRAPEPWGQGWSWFPTRGATAAERLAGMEAAIALVAARIQALQAALPGADKPVITGFSQGGMLSFGLAARHPELASLVIPVGGLLPDPLFPEQAPAGPLPPVRALHGAADDRVPAAGAAAATARLQALGFDASLQSYEGVGHGISAEMRRELSRLLVTGGRAPPASELP